MNVIEPLTLDDPGAADPAVTGAKAAGLARLRLSGFDVPDGVVLPIGLADAWPDGQAPAPLRTVVDAICTDLGGPVAVRSSTTWEDGATSAHAGATTTVLDVSGTDAVLDAVRECLDATTEAQRVHGTQGAIAVLIQRLVGADWAGVAFSADPITGERGVVRLAATRGLGEALVQGDVVGIDVTVRGDRIEGELEGLEADLALAVAAAARKIEAEFGSPQDVEWAIADRRVQIVQARPITVLPIEPAYPSGNNWQKDTAHFPEPVTPFGFSVLHVAEEDVREVFDASGVLIRGLEEVSVGGQIYSRAVPAMGKADDAGSAPPAIVLGALSRVVPAVRRKVKTAKHVVASGLFQRWADDWHRRDRDEMTRRELDLRSIDLTVLDDADLIAHLDACVALVREGMRIHFQLVMPLFGSLYRLRTIVAEELGWDDSEVFRMLAGHSPATRAADEALDDLRARIHAVPGLVDALRDDPHHPDEVVARHDPDLADAIAAWADEHGWAMVNYDAGIPVLAERPATLTKLLTTQAAPVDFADADEVAARARAAIGADRRGDFDEALAAARAIYPVREDNTIVVGDRPMALLRRWMLEVAVRLVERGALASVPDAAYLAVAELRQALGEQGDLHLDDLVRRRRSEEAWVRANPGPAFLGKQGAMPDISRTPAALRAVNEPILWGVAHEYPPPVARPDDEGVLLAGVAASAGVATGTVRVITSYTDIDRLQPGDVLVCQVTSPSWAPLFPLAAAIVADGGGVLSHAAIAAREHGLPAVLGTATATADLHDGQVIRVDGTNGLVLASGS